MIFKGAMIAIGLYFVVAFANVFLYDWSEEVARRKWHLVFTIIIETIMAIALVQLLVFGK